MLIMECLSLVCLYYLKPEIFKLVVPLNKVLRVVCSGKYSIVKCLMNRYIQMPNPEGKCAADLWYESLWSRCRMCRGRTDEGATNE